MSDNKDIQIPSFMNNNTSKHRERRPRRISDQERAEILEVDFQRTKEQSRNKKVVHAKKSKKKVSKMSAAKKTNVAFGLGVGVTLGIVGLLNKGNIVEIPQKIEEWQITSDYLSDLFDVVKDNEHVKLGGIVWYDTTDISSEFREMLNEGVPEEAIAYVTATSFSYTYETDERAAVFYNPFDVSPDDWAKQHGYESIEDENLEKDVDRAILRSYNINKYNQSLNSMLEDTGNQIESNVKGMGGK